MTYLSRNCGSFADKRVADWSERHSVGLGPLDHDHNLIFIALGTLENELKFLRRGPTLSKTVKFLSHLTSRHFTREEHLMESLAYPRAREHREQHGLLTAWMEAVLPSLGENRRPSYDDAVVAYLADWWSLHNERADKEYGRFADKRSQEAMTILDEFALTA
ncbi:MAG: hemerythrin family protein [Alphaproteobacteria bacterium]|nr:hemerythrin family protein [Alphaproteobacteria bacterium]